MRCACENQRFKAAVNAYVHKRIDQLNKFSDGLAEIDPTYCARHEDAVIYDVWKRCLTETDHDEIKTHCCEWSTLSEIHYATVKYYDQQRDDEMERQILILTDERQRNGNKCA